jgi:putative membrane protein
MKRLSGPALALLLCATPAFAQTTVPAPPAAPGGSASSSGGVAGGFAGAITPPSGSADTVGANDLVKGANSFTEGQARSRLEHNGYSQVSALTKGNDGIWRGTATKNGSAVHVGVDFKGDISMN